MAKPLKRKRARPNGTEAQNVSDRIALRALRQQKRLQLELHRAAADVLRAAARTDVSLRLLIDQIAVRLAKLDRPDGEDAAVTP